MAKGTGMILSIADTLGSRAIRATRSLGMVCDYFITSVLL
jgi:hypothetical protein